MRVDLEQSLVESRLQTRDRLAPRGSGYVWLLRALEHSGKVLGKDRGKMIEADYLWMRGVDDVVDGHLALPHGYSSRQEFVLRKLDFLQTLGEPSDLDEELMVLAAQLSQKIGIELQEERAAIVGSMMFDATRVGTGEIFPVEVLNEYFFRLDIEGTIAGSLKVFREDVAKTRYLLPLGTATRIQYNLRDFEEDIAAGYVNVSREDCERFHITPDDLWDVHSPGVQEWFRSEAERGLDLLSQHRDLVGQAHFGPVGRVILPFSYERPARNFFEGVLN